MQYPIYSLAGAGWQWQTSLAAGSVVKRFVAYSPRLLVTLALYWQLGCSHQKRWRHPKFIILGILLTDPVAVVVVYYLFSARCETYLVDPAASRRGIAFIYHGS